MKHALKTLFILPLIFLINSTASAQEYFDRFSVPDTTKKSEVQACISILDYFTRDLSDSLYVAVKQDSSVVNYDTLKKYSHQHKENFKHSDGGLNKSIWEVSSGEYTLTRTYAGMGKPGGDYVVHENVLEVKVMMQMKNGKLEITRISFRIVPATEDAKKYIINPREERMKRKQKLLQEDMMKKAPKPPGFPK